MRLLMSNNEPNCENSETNTLALGAISAAEMSIKPSICKETKLISWRQQLSAIFRMKYSPDRAFWYASPLRCKCTAPTCLVVSGIWGRPFRLCHCSMPCKNTHTHTYRMRNLRIQDTNWEGKVIWKKSELTWTHCHRHRVRFPCQWNTAHRPPWPFSY